MSLLEESPCNCVNSDLDFNSVPPANTSIVKNYYEKVEPTASANSGTVQFSLKSTNKDFISLHDSFLQIKVKILKEDKTPPAVPTPQAPNVVLDEAKVFPVNYFGATMFKNVKTFINGIRMSECNDLYGYKAMFEFLLSYDTSVAHRLGALGLFYKDTKEFNEVTNVTGGDHNAGVKKRFSMTKNGKEIEMFVRVHNDLFAQTKMFPGDLPLIVEFDRAEEKFCLMAHGADTKYFIQVEDINMYVKRFRLTDTFYEELMRARIDRNLTLKYPMRRTDMKYVTFGPNRSILQGSHVVNNTELPKRVVIALLRLEGFTGHNNHNPFKFENMNVTEVELKVNDGGTPFYQYNLDYPNDEFYMAYMAMLKSTGELFRNEPLNITPDEFKNGTALYCFDITKNGIDSETFELTENGSLSFVFKLGTVPTHGVAAVIYMEYDSLLIIGPNNATTLK